MKKKTSYKALTVVLMCTAMPGLSLADSFPLSSIVQIDDGSSVQVSVLNPLGKSYPLSKRTAGATEPQLNPLKAPITISFETQSVTVGNAVASVTAALGYKLLRRGNNVAAQTVQLLDSDLPLVHKSFDNLPADEILRSLSGPGFVPVVDHVARLITFDPIPLFAKTGRYARQISDERTILDTSERISEKSRMAKFIDKLPTVPKKRQTKKYAVVPKPKPVDKKAIVSKVRPVEKIVIAPPEKNKIDEGDLIVERKQTAKIKQTTVPTDEKAKIATREVDFHTIQSKSFMFAPSNGSVAISADSGLDSLLSRFEPNTDRIVVIGCSDSRDNKAVLALGRANIIKQTLLNKGVATKNVATSTCFASKSLIPSDPNSVFVDHQRL